VMKLKVVEQELEIRKAEKEKNPEEAYAGA
jgi:hypothetical protein